MVNPESSDSPQIKLIRECSRGFQTRDPNLIAKALHKDFRNVPYPRSLGWPEQTKEEFLEQYVGMSSLWAADPEVSYIGYSIGPFAATKSLPQPTYRFIADVPGKVVVHVRI